MSADKPRDYQSQPAASESTNTHKKNQLPYDKLPPPINPASGPRRPIRIIKHCNEIKIKNSNTILEFMCEINKKK